MIDLTKTEIRVSRNTQTGLLKFSAGLVIRSDAAVNPFEAERYPVMKELVKHRLRMDIWNYAYRDLQAQARKAVIEAMAIPGVMSSTHACREFQKLLDMLRL